jgi:hypothetical protein
MDLPATTSNNRQPPPTPTNTHQQGWTPPAGLVDPFSGRTVDHRGTTGPGFDIGTDSMVDAVAGALGGSSSQAPGSDGAGPGMGMDGSASAAGAAPTGSSIPALSLDPAKLRECRGLPVPNAAGGLVALGSRPLWLVPTVSSNSNTDGSSSVTADDADDDGSVGGSPATLLPPGAASDLLHPDAVAALLPFARDAAFRWVSQAPKP